MPSFELFVGIDIAAKSFTASLLKAAPHAQPQRPETFAQDATGFAKFDKHLQANGSGGPPDQILVVLEATSTYWLNLAVHLHEAGFSLMVINPSQPHFFAKTHLKKVKTDQLDAANLALYARFLRDNNDFKPWSPPPQVYHELHQRLQHRDQLIEMRQQLKNQLHALKAGAVVITSVRESMEQLITNFTTQLKQIEEEIEEAAYSQHAQWAKTIQLLQTIPGIGLMTAALLVAVYFNFTNCPSAQAAAQYAGLAPNEGSSGTSVHKRGRIGGGGNAPLRRMLYMASLSACRYNPVIKAYYESHSVTKQGKKPMKVARCGAARKLLHLAYAVATKGVEFDAAFYERQKVLRQQPKTPSSKPASSSKAC